MKYFLKITFVLFTVILVLYSCTSRKKITYLQNKEVFESQDSLVCPTVSQDYHIQNRDLLHVDLYTPFHGDLKQVSSLFEKNSDTKSGNYAMWNSEASQYINGFLVDEKGEITLPLIGRVKVVGKTMQEIEDVIEKKANEYVTGVQVTVKFMNFDYTVIGEVTKPGTYRRYNTRLNLFEALGKAGDVTVNGDKTKIKIIRDLNGQKEVYLVDATQTDIISSRLFYLQPNDIIYVEPLGNKSFRQNLPNISILLSSISTIILVLNFINRN